jgi:hypothetical protein
MYKLFKLTQEKIFQVEDRKVKMYISKNRETVKVTLTDMQGRVLATRHFSRGWRPRHWNLTACKGGWDAKLSYRVGRGQRSYRTGEYLDFRTT